MTHYFAICELKNGEYECVRVDKSILIPKVDRAGVDYKATVSKVIEQLSKDNETRKEKYKMVKFVDFVQHGSGFGAHGHSIWARDCCENAKKTTIPIYDFEHPENGIEY